MQHFWRFWPPPNGGLLTTIFRHLYWSLISHHLSNLGPIPVMLCPLKYVHASTVLLHEMQWAFALMLSRGFAERYCHHRREVSIMRDPLVKFSDCSSTQFRKIPWHIWTVSIRASNSSRSLSQTQLVSVHVLVISYISRVQSLGQSYLLKLVAQRKHASGEHLPNVRRIPSERAFSLSVDIDELVHVRDSGGAGGSKHQLQRVRGAVRGVLVLFSVSPYQVRGFKNENEAFEGCECYERCAQSVALPDARVPHGEERALMPVRDESGRHRDQAVGATVPWPALRRNEWTSHSGDHPRHRESNQTGHDN